MKKIKLTAIILYLGMGGLFAQHNISGSIHSKTSGKGQEYINVLLFKLSDQDSPRLTHKAVSDRNGRFVFNGISDAKYRLQISAVGFKTMQETFFLNSNKDFHFEMEESHISVGEVVVSSLRHETLEKRLPYPIAVLDRNEVKKSVFVSVSDAIGQEAGVSLVRDGAWGTSVNIRGLGEDRIVSLVNGNRIETAKDLHAGLSMIFPDDIERIEVLKGSSSSLFGTGALGGVVNIITREGKYSPGFSVNGDLSSSYSSVNNMFSEYLGLQMGSNKWNARVSGGWRKADDIMTPEGILDNSQFEDRNISASFAAKPFDNHELKLQFQDYNATDVGIPGGAAFPGPATATYPEENRRMYSAEYAIRHISKVLNEVKIKYFNQYILRDVEMIPNTPSVIAGNQRITAQRITPTAHHYTQGLNLVSDWNTSEANHIIFGAELWQRQLNSNREKHILKEVLNENEEVIKTVNLIKGETPLPTARFASAGLYLQDEYKVVPEKLHASIGGRIDRIFVDNEETVDTEYLIIDGVRNDNPPGQRITFEENSVRDLSWSADIGFLYFLKKDIHLSLSAARSYRSPSIEERYKYIDLGSKVRLGDPKLKSEKGYFYDAGIKIWKNKLNFQVNVFANFLSDMIVEIPGEFIYRLSAGDAEIKDTLPALINSNVDKALLYGADLSLSYNPWNSLVLNYKLSYVRGINRETQTDLPLIPPFRSNIHVKYLFPKFIGCAYELEWVSDQNRVADGETPTEGYVKMDAYVFSREFSLGGLNLQLFSGLENLTDVAYMNHLATNRGMIKYEPGRNVFVKLLARF